MRGVAIKVQALQIEVLQLKYISVKGTFKQKFMEADIRPVYNLRDLKDKETSEYPARSAKFHLVHTVIPCATFGPDEQPDGGLDYIVLNLMD